MVYTLFTVLRVRERERDKERDENMVIELMGAWYLLVI
jgi:hypothetical protein